MSKKSGGLFTLLTGAAMGAAAVFLSNKQNRVKTSKVIKSAQKKYGDNPKKAVKDAVSYAKKEVQKAQTKAKQKTTSSQKSTKKITKK